MERFAWKGNIYHTNEERKIEIFENSWVLCEDGICKGVVKELPEEWKNVEITDFGDKIIIPGLCDLHVTSPLASTKTRSFPENPKSRKESNKI